MGFELGQIPARVVAGVVEGDSGAGGRQLADPGAAGAGAEQNLSGGVPILRGTVRAEMSVLTCINVPSEIPAAVGELREIGPPSKT